MKKEIKKAFSLIEMVIVLAIIGMLLVVGLPAIRNYQQRYITKNTADQIVLLLRQLQSLSLSPSTQVERGKILGYVMNYNSSEKSITISPVVQGDLGNIYVDTALSRYNLPSNVSLSQRSASNCSASLTQIFPLFFSTPIDDPNFPYKRRILFNYNQVNNQINGNCNDGSFSRYIALNDSFGQCFIIEINCQTGKIELK